MGLSLRKLCTSPWSPEARIKQDQFHEITLQRIALLLDEGLKSKYVIGSDEFGMLLFPQGQYRRRKTEVGHCQKECQDGAKLQGTTALAFWVSKFVPALTSHGWNTSNKSLPKNWSGRENTYTEVQATLGKEGIRLIRMRQGVSSDSDEQVGCSSQSTVTQTNVDKDEMEDVVDGGECIGRE